MSTVTVTRVRRGFTSAFSALPGQVFGPYDLPEMVRDLTVSALLSPRQARDLVLQAAAEGQATSYMDRDSR
jgi:hypothetical protein